MRCRQQWHQFPCVYRGTRRFPVLFGADVAVGRPEHHQRPLALADDVVQVGGVALRINQVTERGADTEPEKLTISSQMLAHRQAGGGCVYVQIQLDSSVIPLILKTEPVPVQQLDTYCVV